MAEYVEAGILSALGKTLAGIWRKMLTSEKVEEESANEPVYDDSGVEIGYLSTIQLKNDHEIKVKVESINKENKTKPPFNVYILSDTGEKESFEDLKSSNEVQKSVALFIDSYWDKITPKSEAKNSDEVEDFNQAFGTGMAASKKLQVSLSKISSSSEITLHKVYANYDAITAYQDLEDVLSSPDVTNSLDENEVSLEIIPLEDEYEINYIDKVEDVDSTAEIIKSQITAILNLYAIANSCTSLDSCTFNPLVKADTIKWQFDWIAQSTLSSHLDIGAIIRSIDLSTVGTWQDMEQLIADYTCVLDLYYPNYSHEIQSLFDSWLLTLRYR